MLTKNIKNKISILLFILLFATGAAAQSSWMTVHGPARNLIWPGKLEREIGFLSDSICAGRAIGTRGSVEAAAWIVRKFKKTGLMPVDSLWSRTVIAENGAIGHNIIGFLPGSVKAHPTKYVIVMAHYDHLGEINGRMFPGADSNASGVVAMTSLAEMISMTRMLGTAFPVNFIFVGLDGKEANMAGSQGLWNMIALKGLRDPVTGRAIARRDIRMVVNIDQIGSSLSPLDKDRKDYVIMLDGSTRRTKYKEILTHCNRTYGTDLDIGFSYYGSGNFTRLFYRLSDHKIFADNRIPSIMFTSGITMNNNKVWDNVESLDMEILRKRIYLIYHWLCLSI